MFFDSRQRVIAAVSLEIASGQLTSIVNPDRLIHLQPCYKEADGDANAPGRSGTAHPPVVASFNARSIDAVLASLGPDVVWANGLEGWHVQGHKGVGRYWQRQFSQIWSTVTPVAIDSTADGRVRVEVHQVVRSADGAQVLADTTVGHLFTLNFQGLIERLTLGEGFPGRDRQVRGPNAELRGTALGTVSLSG